MCAISTGANRDAYENGVYRFPVDQFLRPLQEAAGYCGLTWAELGRPNEAADDLAAYLTARSQADDAAALHERLAELRQGGGPRLH